MATCAMMDRNGMEAECSGDDDQPAISIATPVRDSFRSPLQAPGMA